MNRFVSIGVAMICVAGAANATVVSISTIRAGSTYRPTSTPGAPVFAMEPHSPLFVVRGGSNIHRGFMVFDLSAVPTGAEITSVTYAFTQQSTAGTPTMEVWGDYQSGELAYDTYFPISGLSGWTQVYPNDTPFHSMTNDGSLFGQAQLTNGDGFARDITLNGAGTLAYFQSQIGGKVLLFCRLAHDMDYYDGAHGNGSTPRPTLRVEYVCAADANHDGFVNGDDYDAFAEGFESADPSADFNHDGFVNGDDYDAFAERFEMGC